MAAKPTAPDINLEDLKARLAGLKTRADAMALRKEAILKEATIQEQNQERALAELADLGFPEAKGMNLTELAQLGADLGSKLTLALGSLETAVVNTEKLLGIAQAAGHELD